MQRARWAVSAMFLANGFLMGAWAPQIPLLLPRHGIGEGVLGLLILGLGLGAVGAMLFTGRLIARHGAARVLTWFAISTVPVLPVVVLAPTLSTVALAMVAFGALVGSMDVAMNANAVEVERGLGRAIMSASHGFWSLGGFLGGSFGGLVIERLGSAGQAALTAALIAATVGTAIPFLHREPPAPPLPDAPHAAFLPRDRALWVLGLLALFAMTPEGAVLDWSALYLRDELGLSLEWSGLGFAFFAGTMAVMRFAGDAVRDRFGAVRVLRASALIAAAGLVGAAAAPGPGLAIAAFALAGLGVANMVPVIFSAAGNHPGLPSGTAMATVTMVGYAGILVAPSTIGFVAEVAGFRLTYAALALLLVAVALLAGRARAAERG